MGSFLVAFIIVCATIYSANSSNISSENSNGSIFSDCNGKVVLPGTIITSENYPEQYPNNKNCYIDIEFEVGQQVEVTFLDFDVPGKANRFSSGCSTSGDYVKLFDGYIAIDDPYCQFNQPVLSSSVTSIAETLTINFRTNYNSNEYQGSGFKLIVDTPPKCYCENKNGYNDNNGILCGKNGIFNRTHNCNPV